MNIGLKIRTLRIKKQMKQSEIAQKIKVTSGYISQIENNLITPSLKILFAILKIFEISASEFFKQRNNIEIINHKKNFSLKINKELKNNIYKIFPNLKICKMKCLIIEIENQGQTIIKTDSEKEEFYFVLEGEITLFLDKIQNILPKETGFYLLTEKEYYLFNHTYQKSKVLKVSINY
ncbi:MAG: helix-turn-helix transcriptional regulator [Candidatus Phytoplasma cynodontis]|uniref:helix-turn-helix domain-containing protein n=1 Tax='Cynodon dactylon' phytoplasma TaxID=295320 RepID=UPI001265B251|nr:helix-turn-helix transcriptional regulator ['Cynodon dactylon' phytoplasma]KAB8122057.1 helix-turn-helix domain-containing protein ['Cynodon dactylon' phytoplasma]WIA07528.1 MAG: helix-turn-helix transcriptional regulator [Candidatus Phytoplasma cynodontis]